MADMTDTKPETAEKAKSPVKYEVLIPCYWNNVLYRQGDIVELPAGVKPFVPEYFKKI